MPPAGKGLGPTRTFRWGRCKGQALVGLVFVACRTSPPPAPPAAPPATTPVRFQSLPPDEAVENPERGFLQATSDLLAEPPAFFAQARARGFTLVRGTVRLDRHRKGLLPPALLNRLSDAFAKARTSGLKVVLRFAYNDSAAGEDAPISVVSRHIDQVAPVLAANKDVLFALEAGFIGAWGEWHSSRFLSRPEDRRQVLSALLRAVPADRAVLVRTPAFKHELAPSSTRVGHHNDCFAAGEDDAGTFAPPPAARWREAVETDTAVPVGGETCAPAPPHSDCAAAEAALSRQHHTYLNSDHHPGVLAAWSAQGCLQRIGAHLGARLVLERADLPQIAVAGRDMAIAVRLRNDGYAAPVNPRPVFVTLSNGSRWTLPAAVDPRTWRPGTHDVALRVALPSGVSPGVYRVGLWLPDASASLAARAVYALRFANAHTWDAATGDNVIGTLRVDGP